MVSGEQAYSIYREQAGRVEARTETLPDWLTLPWARRDHWDRVADEINGKDREEQF